MIRRIPLVSALVAACAAWPAAASDRISNSFIDARYLNSVAEYDMGEDEPADDEIEGWEGSVSVGLAEYLNFVGSYSSRRYFAGRDGYGSAGLAGHTTGRNFQAFGSATYEQIDFDRDVGPTLQEATQDGWGVALGVKYKMPGLEVMASAKYAGYNDYFASQMSALTYEAGAGLQLSPYWEATFGGRYRDLAIEPETGDTFHVRHMEWSAGLRHYFITSADKWKRKGGIFGGEE